MPRRLRWKQVDVFADRPLSGSALAVFLDGRGLEGTEMQALAREVNLPAAAFVLPPSGTQAAYRVRAFNPVTETSFNGNAVLGTAYALADEGMLPLYEPLTTVFQESGVGVYPVDIEVADGKPRAVTIAQTPPVAFGRVFGRPGSPVVSALATALGVSPDDLVGTGLFPTVVDTGVQLLVLSVDEMAKHTALSPDFTALGRVAEQLGLAGFPTFSLRPLDPKAQVHLRFFTPGAAMREEPANAGAAAAVGAYLAKWKVIRPEPEGLARFILEEGLEVGRPGSIEVAVGADPMDPEAFSVRVTGRCVSVAAGEVVLP